MAADVVKGKNWVSGIGAGLAAALLFTQSLAAMLFGRKATDPAALVGAAVLLFAIAMSAGSGPASRASLIQPMQALSHE